MPLQQFKVGLETGALKTIDQSAPYAEIWLGTHPSGPSLLDDGTELSKVVKGGNLPWLLKVLSAGKALSIQAHPDKSLAEKLHKDKPDLYKDSNHKPEMAIALTPFEAMCGFRRLSEIAVHLRKHPEFAACISTEAQLAVFTAGPRDSKAQKQALHKVFESFMASDSASAFCLKLDTLSRRSARWRHVDFYPTTTPSPRRRRDASPVTQRRPASPTSRPPSSSC